MVQSPQKTYQLGHGRALRVLVVACFLVVLHFVCATGGDIEADGLQCFWSRT